jgi:hypothetical protein
MEKYKLSLLDASGNKLDGPFHITEIAYHKGYISGYFGQEAQWTFENGAYIAYVDGQEVAIAELQKAESEDDET